MQSESISDNFTVQSEQLDGLHVAIIMDGNGRWATRRGMPRVAGHRSGVAAVRRVVEHAPSLGIATLTLYAFSADNWRRPPAEVQTIFWLLRVYLRLEREKLRQRGARLEVIGRRDRIPKQLLREIGQTESATACGRRLHLRVAIDYSSRDAIARAAMRAAENCCDKRGGADRAGRRLTEAIAAESADVDLLIRTGGEQRLSDFLLWESAYAELLFTDRMWPDFDVADLEDALADFRRRERRFGSVPAPSEMMAPACTGGER